MIEPDGTLINGLELFQPFTFKDHRGSLSKPFDYGTAISQKYHFDVKQIIISKTAQKNTIRGMYIQIPPYGERKVIMPLKGDMFWVAVDLRKNSITFGKWCGVVLSDRTQETCLYIPNGFAHGCISLTDNVELLILADQIHMPDTGLAFRWDDPTVNIKWPTETQPIISNDHAQAQDFENFIKAYKTQWSQS